MKVLEIKVNGLEIRLLEPVKELKSISINHIPGFPIPIDSTQMKPICAWLYELTQKATENILYNGTIISKDDIKGPDDIFKGK